MVLKPVAGCVANLEDEGTPQGFPTLLRDFPNVVTISHITIEDFPKYSHH